MISIGLCKYVGSGQAQQIARVDHTDMRGLVTTGLHCVGELAFLFNQGLSIGNARFGVISTDAGLMKTRVLHTGPRLP